MILEFQALGTAWSIKINSDKVSDLENKVTERIRLFEETYSRFKETSFISKISNTTGEFTLPEDAKPMFDTYFELFNYTGGLFTPLIGQNLVEAGYDKDYSLKPSKLSKTDTLTEVVDYEFPNINIKKPLVFDMGGIGKGYLIDIISDLIKSNGVYSFTINAGGDIYHFDTADKTITVGLEHPLDKSKVIGKTSIKNQSLCASSSNRRNWGKFHHIINPATQKSPLEILATWVIADKAIIADSLATCLFLVPSDSLSMYYDFEYLVLYSDFSIKRSEGFEVEIYHA